MLRTLHADKTSFISTTPWVCFEFLSYYPLWCPHLGNASHPTWVAVSFHPCIKVWWHQSGWKSYKALPRSSLIPFFPPNSRALLFALLITVLFFFNRSTSRLFLLLVCEIWGGEDSCISELFVPRLSTLHCVVGIRDIQINSEKRPKLLTVCSCFSTMPWFSSVQVRSGSSPTLHTIRQEHLKR